MASKNRAKKEKFYSDPLDDYNDELADRLDDEVDDDLITSENMAQDFNRTARGTARGLKRGISARRKIERMNELKELFSQFDDWDNMDVSTEW